MTASQRRANKEVLTLLNEYDLTSKIPVEVLANIKNNQDEDWVFDFDESLNLEDQGILRETAVLFSALYMIYICEDGNEKAKLIKQYKDNEMQLSDNDDLEKVINKYMSKKDELKPVSKDTVESNSNIALKENKTSFFARIKNWFHNIFLVTK